MKHMLMACGLLMMAGITVQAQDQKVMHCFTYTQIEAATPADWAAFAKATDALPGQIPGLVSVWYGKLARPMGLFMPEMPPRPPAPATADAKPPAPSPEMEKMAKLRAGETVEMKIKAQQRQQGVCMLFSSQDALKAYSKHEAHAAWMKAYEKVRVPGTTTFDILLAK
jgi:hypothetical protein